MGHSGFMRGPRIFDLQICLTALEAGVNGALDPRLGFRRPSRASNSRPSSTGAGRRPIVLSSAEVQRAVSAGTELLQLKEKFGISMQAIFFRANAAGILTDSGYGAILRDFGAQTGGGKPSAVPLVHEGRLPPRHRGGN